MVLTQFRELKIDGIVDSATFRGAPTLVIDLSKVKIQYAILKRLDSETHIDGKTIYERKVAYLKGVSQDTLWRLLLTGKEPLAAMHTLLGTA